MSNNVNSLSATTVGKLERIVGWTRKLSNTMPTKAALAGNLIKLADLAAQARQLSESAPAVKAILEEKKVVVGIESLKTILLSLQTIIENGNGVEIEHVSWLLTVPSGDINFKHHLKTAQHPATLHYILALFPLYSQGKTARKAIEQRLRSIERQNEKIAKSWLQERKNS